MAFACAVCGATSHNPSDEAHGYCGRCHAFTGRWRQIAPGAWDDGAGGLHVDLAAMLEGNGYADTAENRALLEAAAADMAAAIGAPPLSIDTES